MPSLAQIAKAEKATVRAINKTETIFEIVWFDKHSKRYIHYVRLSKEEGLKLKDRFLAKGCGCDCKWFATKTVHGDKMCYHILAVVKWLAEKEIIHKEIWESLKSGECIY